MTFEEAKLCTQALSLAKAWCNCSQCCFYFSMLFKCCWKFKIRIQSAGGAGCGRPPAHKARRKANFEGSQSQLAANPTTSRLWFLWSLQLWWWNPHKPACCVSAYAACSSAKTRRTNHRDHASVDSRFGIAFGSTAGLQCAAAAPPHLAHASCSPELCPQRRTSSPPRIF